MQMTTGHVSVQCEHSKLNLSPMHAFPSYDQFRFVHTILSFQNKTLANHKPAEIKFIYSTNQKTFLGDNSLILMMMPHYQIGPMRIRIGIEWKSIFPSFNCIFYLFLCRLLSDFILSKTIMNLSRFSR